LREAGDIAVGHPSHVREPHNPRLIYTDLRLSQDAYQRLINLIAQR
jgi:hypothetical protein